MSNRKGQTARAVPIVAALMLGFVAFALAGRGTVTVSNVVDNGNGSYTLTVNSTSGVTVGDHFGARVGSTAGPGGVWEVMSIGGGTSMVVSDTLVEENGTAFGAPIEGSAWYSTPTTSGFSRVPHRAVAYDAAMRRDAHMIDLSKQAASSRLTTLAGLAATSGNFMVGNGTTYEAQSGATARSSLGLGSIATQAANSVTITGGSISGITDLAVADGGTGASDASGARTNLGLVIGTNVQAHDADLAALATLGTTKGDLAVFDGTGWIRVGVGANDRVLTAKSSTTSGVSWEEIPGGGGGGAHSMLSSTHTDTDDYGDGIMRGDVMVVGSATPAAWTRLPIGAAGTVLSSDGTDTTTQTLTALFDAVFSSVDGKIIQRVGGTWIATDPSTGVAASPATAGGRLSVSASDPTGEGTSDTLYYVPYTSTQVATHDGTAWSISTITSSTSLDVSALTHSQVYDVFGYDSSGGLAIEALAWSDHGAGTGSRATGLVYQDGVLVKAGDSARRYLGTIRTVSDSGTKARDSSQYRYVDNVNNRVPYRDSSHDSTDTWASSGVNLTWAARNGGDPAWRHSFVHGMAQSVRADGLIGVSTESADAYAGGPALNWTSGAPGAGTLRSVSANGNGSHPENYTGTPPTGYGYVQCVETSAGSGTAPTVRGDAGGTFWGSGLVVVGER